MLDDWRIVVFFYQLVKKLICLPLRSAWQWGLSSRQSYR